MATMETDRLVDDYLQRLEDAAAHLQRSRRAELIAEIRGHIEAALREEDAAGEVAVRNVLERLGPPEEIVEAAGPPPADTAPSQKLEIVALVALLVPFLGWVVGVVLVAVSRAWTNRDKLIGIALLVIALAVPALAVTFSAAPSVSRSVPTGSKPDVAVSADGDNGHESLGLVLAVLAGVPSAAYLGWRLRGRAPADRVAHF